MLKTADSAETHFKRKDLIEKGLQGTVQRG